MVPKVLVCASADKWLMKLSKGKLSNSLLKNVDYPIICLLHKWNSLFDKAY